MKKKEEEIFFVYTFGKVRRLNNSLVTSHIFHFLSLKKHSIITGTKVDNEITRHQHLIRRIR